MTMETSMSGGGGRKGHEGQFFLQLLYPGEITRIRVQRCGERYFVASAGRKFSLLGLFSLLLPTPFCKQDVRQRISKHSYISHCRGSLAETTKIRYVSGYPKPTNIQKNIYYNALKNLRQYFPHRVIARCSPELALCL